MTMLQQGMLNSPTLCQYFVSEPLEIKCKQFSKSITYHYTDEILLCELNLGRLEMLLEEIKEVCLIWVLQIDPGKIHRGDSVKYLVYRKGYKN